MHLALEGGVVGVLDGLHACGVGGCNVFGTVVDEEDVCRFGLESFGCDAVDFQFRLGQVESVGPSVVIEIVDPGVTGTKSCFHCVGHVGEDAGADAALLKAANPVEHWGVERAPEINVGGDEVGDLKGSENDDCAGGDFRPVGFGVEVAAVVGVAVGPVFAVEGFFFEAGDGAHALPCGGIGWA